MSSRLGHFARRTGDPEVATDLYQRLSPRRSLLAAGATGGQAPAAAWLFAIAARRLADYRRGRVEARARQALAMERVALGAEDAEMVRMLAGNGRDAAGPAPRGTSAARSARG